MSRYCVIASWEDAPHLSSEAKAEMEAAMMPHEKAARTRGVPSLGAGAIYPIDEDDIVCSPFEIPAWYRCCGAIDFGWARTAGIWAAHDYESDTVYLYSEYYRSAAEPPIHAEGIKARGSWVPLVCDPAGRGRSQVDGNTLLQLYRDLGVTMTPANNSVESGIYLVWSRLSSGKLKVFSTLKNWLAEFRTYRRNTDGKIVKENDHLLDATRYLVLSGLARAAALPSHLWLKSPRPMPAGISRSVHEFEYDASPMGNLERRR